MASRPTPPWCLCATLAVCGCSSPTSTAPAAPLLFVGNVSGTDARIAVVATQTHARIYFCGGETSYASLSHWIPSVPIGDSGVSVAPADGAGWSLEGHVDPGGVSGSVSAADAGAFAFHAEPLARGTIAGLYEAVGPCGKIGVIVSQASSAVAASGQGACIGNSGSVAAPIEQVNPIRPLARAGDGAIAVLVDGATVLVHPAAPPSD